jgi:hypothetical protein
MAPEKLDSLDAESLKPLLHQLLARIDDLLAENKKLLARIAELEARLGQPPKTPDNSSLPPSRGQKANAGPPVSKPQRKGRPRVARMLVENPADPGIPGASGEEARQLGANPQCPARRHQRVLPLPGIQGAVLPRPVAPDPCNPHEEDRSGACWLSHA